MSGMSIKWASLLTFDLSQRAVGVLGYSLMLSGGLLWANRAQVNTHISLDSSLHPHRTQSAAEEKMNSLVPVYTISLSVHAMSHISTFTIQDDTETVMAADVTPWPHEIKTGFCNMLVKGNLPGWKPLQPLLYNRKTTHHLLRYALHSFFHLKLILQLSCGHASSVPHRMHLIEYIKQSLQTLHILHKRSRLKEKRGI